MLLTSFTSVAPLDTQIGIWPKRTVPAVLEEPLFGQPADEPRMPTWAIVDAAKIPNLPEELANSDLPHRCLFRGKARDDWGHVAPWLVALAPDARLTRRLFTEGGPVGLWTAAAAMLLRSRWTLDELWRHFRKFTRVEDENGKWLYFRFWEEQSLTMLVRSAKLSGARRFFLPCEAVFVPIPDRGLCMVIDRTSTVAPLSVTEQSPDPTAPEMILRPPHEITEIHEITVIQEMTT